MIRIRRGGDRGHADHGWLDTWHTFSFGDYHDSAHTNFRALRVMNEDRVQPGQGFGMHGHRNMEIVTYVLEGALEHRDSLGNGSILKPGELQRMTAGTGIRHSEFNPSATDPTHLYQIWLDPDREGLPPGYEQRTLPPDEGRGHWRLVASPDGRDDSLTIHQNARIWLVTLDRSQAAEHELAPNRHAWLQVLRGEVALQGFSLVAGDGAAVSDESQLKLQATSPAEIMLFDLA
ncbi:MAG: pirin family protein [Planctomycetales bacterium]|nr:pirin family protein [Planctomycetales bacterium]